MARIEIADVSVSYYIRRRPSVDVASDRGKVGGRISMAGRYVEISALEGVSLSFAPGDRVGLIGTNGSGKSTLLRLCAGALATRTGSVVIEGRVTAQFAMGAGIRPGLTGRRNAELKCLYLGIPQGSIARRVEEVKELSGLGGYFELPVQHYSAGMHSRLVMSLLRLVRAEILVMDEWIGAADASLGNTNNTLQTELIGSASIVILASHSERILEEWTNRLVWLDRGRVAQVGPFAEVYAAYRKRVAG